VKPTQSFVLGTPTSINLCVVFSCHVT